MVSDTLRLFSAIMTVWAHIKLVSIDSIFHDSCKIHVLKLMRASLKNDQSSKLPKPIPDHSNCCLETKWIYRKTFLIGYTSFSYLVYKINLLAEADLHLTVTLRGL